MADTAAPKTLLLSCRAQNANLAASSFYEFEDLIHDWMGAELLAPADLRYNIRRKAQSALYKLTHSSALARPFASPRLGSRHLHGTYDLVFATLPNMGTTYKLIDFQNLRQSARVLACYIPEVWTKGISEFPFRAEPLKQCDHIFVSTRHSVDTVRKLTGRPCTFLHFAVDAVKFSPHPFHPARLIDVLNIGRRSPVTHAALIEAAKTSDFYYVYDTVNSNKFIQPEDHRLYYANTAKRTKFYIANSANFDQLWKTGGAVEIGHRYYEGAAAGAVIVGATPMDHEVIRQDFDWPDAIIEAPYDAPRIVEELHALGAGRVEEARRANAVNSLLRHDFVYRWAEVLGLLGFAVTPKMKERMATLKNIAAQIQSAHAPGTERPQATGSA